MQPQNSPGMPAHQPNPTLSPQQGPSPVAPAPMQVPQAAKATTPPANAYVLQAKQLVMQHRHNPYQLNMALQQLKADYLARSFGISPNSGQK